MDKAIIIGAFEFIGFNLTKHLLDEGIEVDGIHTDTENEGFFVSGKRLEIGRNANFKEIEFEDWMRSKDVSEHQTVTVISLYDYFINHRESLLFSDHGLCDKLQKILSYHARTVLLLPAQYYFQKGFTDFEKTAGSDLSTLLKEEDPALLKIYLPTVYGPWQSPASLFQQCFLKELDPAYSIPENDHREWTDDAIYVDAVVETIGILINQTIAGSFLLANEETGHWHKCAELLGIDNAIDRNIQTKKLHDKNDIEVQKVKMSITAREGIKKQKEHLENSLLFEND
ncbi:hypothetical protein [Bacillus canaveralius]|uniref:hypothetical protein n=1 Tax=Bacillus canaveralius TaxID=1403243 RepID=UPI000F7B276B|nr:hypothetical protein [Bacillus canaveralius]RSK56015.1 hypothetical protein EJA13_02835 [Bacillus canaveralius]